MQSNTGHHHGLPFNTCNIRWERQRERERVHRKQHTNVKPTSVCALVHVHFTSCVHNSQNRCSHHCTGLGFCTIFPQWETFLKYALVRATCLLLTKFTLYLSSQNHLCSRWVETRTHISTFKMQCHPSELFSVHSKLLKPFSKPSLAWELTGQ